MFEGYRIRVSWVITESEDGNASTECESGTKRYMQHGIWNYKLVYRHLRIS